MKHKVRCQMCGEPKNNLVTVFGAKMCERCRRADLNKKREPKGIIPDSAEVGYLDQVRR